MGDPTNGHGAISYVKKPLKMSRYDKSHIPEEDIINPGITLSGSDSDLRKLKLTKVDAFLKKYGENPKRFRKRWDKIQKLREIAEIELKKNPESELKKFAR